MNKIHSNIPMRNDTAKHIREVRKILKQGHSEPIFEHPENNWMNDQENAVLTYTPWILWFASFVLALCLIASCSHAYAETIEGHDIQVWANAINKAENSPSHPYGIIAKYRHTSPRQACINTVRHQYRIWCKNTCNKTFIVFLASKYAPLMASNDLKNLNSSWIRNVSYFLSKGDL